MTMFGKRLTRPTLALANAEDFEARRVDGAPFEEPFRSHPVVMAILVFALVGAVVPGQEIIADRHVALSRDLQPGLELQAEAYRAPSACPARTWSEREYLPFACMDGYVLSPFRNPQLGLEEPPKFYPTGYWSVVLNGRHRRHRTIFRERHWVRAGADALLVAAPRGAAGEILTVVRGRFQAAPMLSSPPADPTDYRQPPKDYETAVRTELALAPFLSLLMISGYLIWGLARRALGPTA